MSKELANQLLEAGVHFGHQKRKWNPKMQRFIFGARNGVHIINLEKTIQQLEAAKDFVYKTALSGNKVLFIGTKPQANDIVREVAEEAGQPYVNNRWLGGLLTNFGTLRKSIARFKELVAMTTDGTFDKITKKEGSTIKKEITKLEKNLSGVKDMDKLPGGVFVVDPKREAIAVREAVRLGIPVIALADTDADPDMISYAIPGNDDAVRSIRLIAGQIAEAVKKGVAERPKETAPAVKDAKADEAKEGKPAEAVAAAKSE